MVFKKHYFIFAIILLVHVGQSSEGKGKVTMEVEVDDVSDSKLEEYDIQKTSNEVLTHIYKNGLDFIHHHQISNIIIPNDDDDIEIVIELDYETLSDDEIKKYLLSRIEKENEALYGDNGVDQLTGLSKKQKEELYGKKLSGSSKYKAFNGENIFERNVNQENLKGAILAKLIPEAKPLNNTKASRVNHKLPVAATFPEVNNKTQYEEGIQTDIYLCKNEIPRVCKGDNGCETVEEQESCCRCGGGQSTWIPRSEYEEMKKRRQMKKSNSE